MRFKLTTSKGNITLELDAETAPESTKNFARYVADGHYDGTIFHRVIDGFMIQGGGFTPDMKQASTRDGIPNEWQNGLKNKRGTLAMARLGGDPSSATAQFFINLADNGFLDQAQPDGAAYAVFGKVAEGMDVVDAIRGVATGNKGGHGDVPLEAVVIEKAELLEG